MCHCSNGESCDPTTGECTSRCAKYWFGPGCQYRDLAEKKFARHASNIDSPQWASKGNDGDTSTCSYTQVAINSINIPWWRVVLETEVTITDIYILTTDDGLQYFPEFEVTVEKLDYAHRESYTKPPDTSVCYRHDNTVPDSTTIHVTCTTPLIGNQVRITFSKKESQLILCDFRINQGRNLAFQQLVNSSSIYKNSDTYFQASFAVNGLVSKAARRDCFATGNFSGTKWLEVEFDTFMDVNYFDIYKYNDNNINNYKIYDTTSSKELLYDSGTVWSPATRGYIGLNRNAQKFRIEKTAQYILTICELELYGDCPIHQCGYDCSTICHCKTMKSLEDKISGICTSGCEGRWTGVNGKCIIECSDNKWGTSCQNDCGACRQGTCDVVSGKCTGDCLDGYYTTDNCTTECNSGNYGYNCQSSCSHNCQNSCNKVNGACFGGCKPGYMDNKCDQECANRTYGHNCNESCNSNCEDVCDHVTGKCTQCKSGWKNDFCDQECDDGTFGVNCSKNCTSKCLNVCNKQTGYCPECQNGWTGNICQTECTNGTYGSNCKHNCSKKCTDICDRSNGSCVCITGWHGDTCLNVTEPPGQSLPVGAIAGACSAFVVVVIIVVIAFFIIRRRLGFNKNANTECIDGKEMEWNNVSYNSEKIESDVQPMASSTLTNPPSNAKVDASEYYMFGNDPDCNKTARSITLKEITQYVKSKIANVDFFDSEFQDIPYGLQYPTHDAKKPGNIGKNRYKELYAYDHSRVVLKTLPSEPDSDYINASYIKGYKKDRAYIASQGPTEKNKNEFWRMIWENNVNLIAMVTKLVEETKNKCLQYWAGNGNSKTFGKVTVFTESEEEFAEYSIRRLKITYDGEKETRNILHYIYTAWPDKNIPNSTCSLLHFWQKVRKNDGNKANHWLVHCSAGVGRTGTFIAIDYLYDQGMDTGYIDINTCVRQLRDQRVNMVQMKEQYRYLYRIMIEALVLPSTPVLLHKFDSYYAELLTEDKKTRQPKLKIEFEVMSQTDCLVKDSETQEYAYKNAKRAENKVKNRYSNILAPDEYRPFMSTHVPGTTNYINAIYMPSYSDLFGYIITQTPLPDTAVDCCRLIVEQDINVVVTFEDNGDNEVGIYLPRKGSIQVGPFDVTLNEEEIKDGYLIRRHTLKFKYEDHAVIQVVCQNWSAGELVPTDPSQMVQILQDISELQRENDNKPVMLQCLNGAERSGLLVVLMNIIERSSIEEEVSILEVVRYLRSRRQQIVPNYEQYKFCHDVILSYIGSNSTYANL
ncbi:hypothetical protein ACF0H5_006121 [Mactra antiquata]